MKIEVLVKPKSSRRKVEQTGQSQYTVWVHDPPVENKANLAVIELLAEHFNVSRSAVCLVRGSKGKKKIFEVPTSVRTRIQGPSTKNCGTTNSNNKY